MKKVLLIFLIWFVIANLFAIVAANRLNLKADTAYPWIDPAKTPQVHEWNPIPLHAKWDSFWHLGIASDGYDFRGYDKLSNIVFFPLFGGMIKVFTPFLLGQEILAGWVASSMFLLLALMFFYKLVKENHPKLNPYLPIFFLLIFPTAFFLNAVYTESLFLFLSIATFYYGLKKNFVLAGIFGMLAALTRITGILLFIPLAWEYFEVYGMRLKTKILPLLLIPLGTLSFFAFHYLRFRDLFLFFKIESRWGRSFTINLDHLNLFSHPAIVNFALDALFAAFAIIVSVLVLKKMRVSYGLYMLATIFIALVTGTMMSIGRYIIVLFPMYIFAAGIKSELTKFTWATASILLFALYTLLFVNWYWAG